MKKWILIFSAIALLLFSLTFVLCSRENNLAALSRQCGIDLTIGKVVSHKDTHGGFHGDGVSYTVLQYPDDSIGEQMEESETWHTLPLPENLDTFLYQPYDDEVSIPEIQDGYYYFYDRHSESTNPYDDSELFQRFSFNFTFAIYDQSSNQIYLIEYDT